MTHAEHHESGNRGPDMPGQPVRTRTLAEYLADHPSPPMFPPTGEAAAKVVMLLLYALILIGIVYIALRSSGIVN